MSNDNELDSGAQLEDAQEDGWVNLSVALRPSQRKALERAATRNGLRASPFARMLLIAALGLDKAA